MTSSERKRQREIQSSKAIAQRFTVIADKICALIDSKYWDDLTSDEYQILQNEAALFRDLAASREGTR